MRLLVVPAAGLGSRLGTSTPKVLVAVNGRPMLDHLLGLYLEYIDALTVVAHPSFSQRIERHLASDDRARSLSWSVVEQVSPTGMLDAIMQAAPAVARASADRVWITWCDQVGLLPATVARLADAEDDPSHPVITFPTVRRQNPYIHFTRDSEGRIVEVLHRREGDALPPSGESDIGLFALSGNAFTTYLPQYAAEVQTGRRTGERNFLPFIAWMASRGPVLTFPASDEMEAVGINTPEDLRAVEQWLRLRSPAAADRSRKLPS